MTDDLGVQKKDRLINELMGTVNALQQKFQGEEDEEKQWLIQNSPNPVIAELMKDMTVSMLHVLSAIGKLEPVNGITISKQFGFSKGNVSKITRRLADKKIIDFEYIPGNKKEVLFRTTSLGREINRLHEALHQKIDFGVHRFLQRYNEEELEFLVKVLHETWQTSWIYPETNENPNELSQSTSEVLGNPIVSKEMSEVTEMLNKLDSRDLKKAKAILHAVFFSE
ncbi:MarR family transcriptional regulator [Paenibacillus urinalis]|uniref:MarR family transcriptional regulator n=2 Tax=Paenibacillus TaxID=44249 RepID=A0ABY7XET1_9BACL|nr:MarR family transcriptional regulator [Paenibacillus urinalis]WDI03344.1 MarR family transcriptional regulator [Paenibacillus urinalis]